MQKGRSPGLDQMFFVLKVILYFLTLYFFFHSQMSNLMNQARLKVLKARDDMISVGKAFSSQIRT